MGCDRNTVNCRTRTHPQAQPKTLGPGCGQLQEKQPPRASFYSLHAVRCCRCGAFPARTQRKGWHVVEPARSYVTWWLSLATTYCFSLTRIAHFLNMRTPRSLGPVGTGAPSKSLRGNWQAQPLRCESVEPVSSPMRL